MKTLLEILQIDGLIIRNIPKYKKCFYFYKEGDESTLKEGEEIIIDFNVNKKYFPDGRKFTKRIEKNSLHGYALTIDNSQGSMVQFSKHRDGFGLTILEAYNDLIKKRGLQ